MYVGGGIMFILVCFEVKLCVGCLLSLTNDQFITSKLNSNV